MIDSQFACLLGKAVRDARESEGLSRLTLALEASIDPSTLERIELGKTTPLTTTLYNISRVIPFNIDVTFDMIEEKLKQLDS